MEEIKAIPWNGYSLVSTFSGCGGSCLGFRMTGFKTLWASEFIPAAREVPVDNRDIRQVKPEEILESIGLEKGQLDVLEGSPPCASFSTAGKREKGWGQVKPYSETKQRVDDLFFEFARILDGLQPKVFVAENVSGLVKGKAKGYFKLILKELKGCGYEVRAKVLDAQWLGVPQTRQRIIFIGVRSDLGIKPAYPKPLPYRYSVKEAIPWIVAQGDNGGFGTGSMREPTVPSGTVGVSPSTGNGQFPPSKVEVRIVHDTSGDRSQGDITDQPCPAVTDGYGGLNSYHYQVHYIESETDISRYAIGDEWEKIKPGQQSDRYFQLTRAPLGGPSGTITQRGGNNTVASVTHPTEKRKFSIAELKRICAFPDDFQLTGTYAQQWERLGRAVPPVMMFHVAQEIRDQILERIDQ
jgi:DNA (cytosine-5)-methyltransferase 1